MRPMLVKMQQNFTLAKGDHEQFKAGVSFQEYVSCDNGFNMSGVDSRTSDISKEH